MFVRVFMFASEVFGGRIGVRGTKQSRGKAETICDFARFNQPELLSASPRTASFEAVFEMENHKPGKGRLTKGLYELPLRVVSSWCIPG
jgi:hypothetical protein